MVAEYFERLVARGGPSPEEDAELTAIINRLWAEASGGGAEASMVLAPVRAALRFTPDTMQGFAFLKPNGYPGCFEIIDRIYRRHHAADPPLFNWDRYWQRHPAAEAVRNRKAYLAELVFDQIGRRGRASVLNVASGPCRDVLELFEACPSLPVEVHCVEQDPRAIDFARELCRRHLSRVTFEQRNALRFSAAGRYDLVWSAGLFDYLPDRLFVRLLGRLAAAVEPGGQLVVGNFAASNPSRPYMELFGWSLQHRSPADLLALATEAGLGAWALDVRSEASGVNLFLHARP